VTAGAARSAPAPRPAAAARPAAYRHEARLRALRAAVPIAFVAGIALSPDLWLSEGRGYPLTPVLDALPVVGRPLDAIWLGALALSLVAVAATARARLPVIAALVLVLGLAVLDQSRWQPWAYQYTLMLAALALEGWSARRGSPPREGTPPEPDRRSLASEPALALCSFVLAAIYFWSGLSKVGVAFPKVVFPELVEPFVGEPAPGALRAAAYAAPGVEVAIGLGLLFARVRPYAIVGAILMHAFILLSIGPLGSDQNSVVWPWYVAMAAFVVIVFWNAPGGLAGARARLRSWPAAARALGAVLVVLAGLLPALSFAGRWDSYLSAALYSGSNLRATVLTSSQAAATLPPSAARELEPTDGGPALRVYDWSMAELNVPPYPARRVLRHVVKPLCDPPAARAGLLLLIAERPDRLSGERAVTRYRCAALR
jgi:hypothetical protein